MLVDIQLQLVQVEQVVLILQHNLQMVGLQHLIVLQQRVVELVLNQLLLLQEMLNQEVLEVVE